MVIDSSAIVAIFRKEPEIFRFLEAIRTASTRLISSATFLETAFVLDQRVNLTTEAAGDELVDFLAETDTSIVPFTEAHARLARDAYRRFGRGHHPAKLNFGDCFSYALAKATDEPLLFKGKDFQLTDIRIA
jgi:ribonuclease VapC